MYAASACGSLLEHANESEACNQLHTTGAGCAHRRSSYPGPRYKTQRHSICPVSCGAASWIVRCLNPRCPFTNCLPTVVGPTAVALNAQQRSQLGGAMPLHRIPVCQGGRGGVACLLVMRAGSRHSARRESKPHREIWPQFQPQDAMQHPPEVMPPRSQQLPVGGHLGSWRQRRGIVFALTLPGSSMPTAQSRLARQAPVLAQLPLSRMDFSNEPPQLRGDSVLACPGASLPPLRSPPQGCGGGCKPTVVHHSLQPGLAGVQRKGQPPGPRCDMVQHGPKTTCTAPSLHALPPLHLPQIPSPGVDQLGGSGQPASGEAGLFDELLELVAQRWQAAQAETNARNAAIRLERGRGTGRRLGQTGL